MSSKDPLCSMVTIVSSTLGMYYELESCWAWILAFSQQQQKCGLGEVMDINYPDPGNHSTVYMCIKSSRHTLQIITIILVSYSSIKSKMKQKIPQTLLCSPSDHSCGIEHFYRYTSVTWIRCLQSMVSRPATLASPGNVSGMYILGLPHNLPVQKLWGGWSSAVCVLTSPSCDSDTCSSLRTPFSLKNRSLLYHGDTLVLVFKDPAIGIRCMMFFLMVFLSLFCHIISYFSCSESNRLWNPYNQIQLSYSAWICINIFDLFPFITHY